MEQTILQLHPGLAWIFAATIFIMLMLDLGLFHKKAMLYHRKKR
ncbi:hypothetical protein [Chitinophaga sedimenti]|nr:hypothetical protein [Chitinophaga sedimenti]